MVRRFARFYFLNESLDGWMDGWGGGRHFILFLVFIRSNDLRGVENEKKKNEHL
jgi:hypothetical protein